MLVKLTSKSIRTKILRIKKLVHVSISLILCTQSCISSKNVTYFNNLPDSAQIKLEKIIPPEPLIQVNDVIQIGIGGENEKTVEYINQHFAGGSVGGASEVVVDIDGNIELPQIEKLKLAGLSKDAARNVITNAYKEYLVNPIVAVKFSNFRFSVLGEVLSPGTFNLTSERVSIFEAVAQAGDLTEFSIRDKVRIIRDINGNREIKLVNLNDKNILNSPDYYLNRYDVIFVQSRSLKLATENFQRTATYITTVASVFSILLLILRK